MLKEQESVGDLIAAPSIHQRILEREAIGIGNRPEPRSG
jgi:hypothetical protein